MLIGITVLFIIMLFNAKRNNRCRLKNIKILEQSSEDNINFYLCYEDIYNGRKCYYAKCDGEYYRGSLDKDNFKPATYLERVRIQEAIKIAKTNERIQRDVGLIKKAISPKSYRKNS